MSSGSIAALATQRSRPPPLPFHAYLVKQYPDTVQRFATL